MFDVNNRVRKTIFVLAP